MQSVAAGSTLTDRPTMVQANPVDLPRETKCLVLHRHPTKGQFHNHDFKTETRPVPLLAEGRVFCKTLAISIDPNMRPMIAGSRRRHDDPEAEIKIGDVMYCLAAAVVIASRDEKVPVGTYGYVHYGASEYGVASRLDNSFEPFAVQPRTQMQLMRYLSVYSYLIGLTAWYSVNKVLDVNAMGHNAVVVVSDARGAVGSLVGQLCKQQGATVIGICGSDEKTEDLLHMGFDLAINYKSEDVNKRLQEIAPSGITHFHDNVGGECADAVLPNMATFGRVAVCGCISEYTKDVRHMNNWKEVWQKRLSVQGFLSADHLDYLPQFHRFIVPLVEAGKIRYDIDVREGGLDHFVETANDLFTGKNHGKLVLKVRDLNEHLPQ